LRQLAEEQMESGAGEGSVLVGAELGRDVPAVHRILRRQPAAERDDGDEVTAAVKAVNGGWLMADGYGSGQSPLSHRRSNAISHQPSPMTGQAHPSPIT